MRVQLKLFNHWHYGDIFTSRCLIKTLIEKYDIVYYHNLNVPLLNDIENLVEIQGIPKEFDMHNSNFENGIVNTWIGQKKMEYFHKYETGCSLKNYLSFIYEVCDFFDIKKRDYEYYFPEVNFIKIALYDKIKHLFENYKNNYKLLVFVSNGNVNSGQSVNFDFTPIISNLSHNNPDVIFFMTEKKNFISDNVIFTSDITELIPDLLQLSYISTFCDLIVGRASGPYSYSLVKENIIDPNKKFISLNNNSVEANYYNNLGFNLEWSNNYNENSIIFRIQQSINNLKSKKI